MMPIDPKIVYKAASAIARDGERPTIRSVRAWLLDRDGTAPSFREIVPALRTWKDKRGNARSVTRALSAYRRLDPEQQAAFQRQAGLGRRQVLT